MRLVVAVLLVLALFGAVGATASYPRLELNFDGVCVAPRLETTPCRGGSFGLDANPIAGSDWYHEREPEYFWPQEDDASLDTSIQPQRVVWQLMGLVRRWLRGSLENNGILLKLADASEQFDAGGPYFHSMSAADLAVRPRLVITYSSPTGYAR